MYDAWLLQGLQQLRRVLVSFSWHNPSVGYCQGLNMLAATGLLCLNEETTFWLLVAIVEMILPVAYYTHGLAASQADQRVLKDLLTERAPKLSAHLSQHHIDLELITFNWFSYSSCFYICFFSFFLTFFYWFSFVFIYISGWYEGC